MKSDFVKIRKKFYVDGERNPGSYKMPGEKEEGEKYEKNEKNEKNEKENFNCYCRHYVSDAILSAGLCICEDNS